MSGLALISLETINIIGRKVKNKFWSEPSTSVLSYLYRALYFPGNDAMSTARHLIQKLMIGSTKSQVLSILIEWYIRRQYRFLLSLTQIQ